MRWVALVGALAVVGSLGLAGCDGEDHKNQAPVAVFSTSPQAGPTPLIVTLDASASTDKEDRIESYAWVTGDGATLAGVVVTHTYERPGEFTVTLRVTDHKGKTSTASQVVTVENRPPVAAFKPYQTIGFADAVMRFDASASTDPDGEIAAMEWDLGDGSWSTGSVVEHRYAVAGDYEVLLRVRDELGGESDAVQGVSVEPEEEYPAYRVENVMCGSCYVTRINNSGLIVFGSWLYRDGTLTSVISPEGRRGRIEVLNDAGQMAGNLWPDADFAQPFFFIDADGSWLIPPQPEEGYEASALAINENGDVLVGERTWRKPSLYLLKQNSWSRVEAPLQLDSNLDPVMNDQGEIVGVTLVGEFPEEELRSWLSRGGAWELLPRYAGTSESLAYAINNSSQIVVSAYGPTDKRYGLLFKEGQYTNIGNLGGASGWGEGVFPPLHLTDSGWVAGDSVGMDGEIHGFRWRDGRMEQLGLSGHVSRAFDINESGDLLGTVDGRTSILDRKGHLYALNAPENRPNYVPQSAVINDLGEAAFSAMYSPGLSFSYHAQPVIVLFSRLLESNEDIPAARALSPLITAAQLAHEDMDLPASCERLYEYDDGVRALTPSGMTQEQADHLRAQTAAIEETLLCP